ncbi:MAG TPA: LapD/MoxY N-terminal periplasmic domain-containing protein, partial [Burkholderiaceae bacterium]|nr:LapD/MoxY N-terminal periplasmic domain-containing protein [Burkholderiaceae bacterium]
MTVLRQLLLSVTVVVALILVGTLVFSVNASRDYLSMQVQSESDNAATSLALMLSQPANQDQASRELLITALFDSGHFEVIELHDSDGNELVARRVQGAAGS